MVLELCERGERTLLGCVWVWAGSALRRLTFFATDRCSEVASFSSSCAMMMSSVFRFLVVRIAPVFGARTRSGLEGCGDRNAGKGGSVRSW